MRHMRHSGLASSSVVAADQQPVVWPLKKEAVVEGDLLLGGLMMVHSREDTQFTCGPIMAQGGIQTVETMLYSLDQINKQWTKFKIGALILDDCDKDTYGLEMAIDFIKGRWWFFFYCTIFIFIIIIIKEQKIVSLRAFCRRRSSRPTHVHERRPFDQSRRAESIFYLFRMQFKSLQIELHFQMQTRYLAKMHRYYSAAAVLNCLNAFVA